MLTRRAAVDILGDESDRCAQQNAREAETASSSA
jgi:hypothetical protein